jgi:hypothetical protein
MITMRAWAWAVLAGLGFGLMVFSFEHWLKQDPQAPWAYGFLCIGNEEPERQLDAGVSFTSRLRYLPASSTNEIVLQSIEKAVPDSGPSLQARLRPKLIELPVSDMGPLVGRLREGRMPEPGRDEMLAGCQLHLDDVVSVEGKTLKIVGILEPSIALFADCYLAPVSKEMDTVFAEGNSSVARVRIVRLTQEEFRDPKIQEQVATAFPPQKFAILGPEIRSAPLGYYTYLGGAALFLLGGVGLLIGLYRFLAARVKWPIFSIPASGNRRQAAVDLGGPSGLFRALFRGRAHHLSGAGGPDGAHVGRST